jgi:hypothetical protein
MASTTQEIIGNLNGAPVLSAEQELAERFAPERIGEMSLKLMQEVIGSDARSILGDRQFFVAYIDADSEYADIPRSTESIVFSEVFEEPLVKVVADYGKYDPGSTFVTVIDMQPKVPVAAGALRITHDHTPRGFKDVNDLVEESPSNPWYEEIIKGYFGKDEAYDPDLAWARLGQEEGVDLKLGESHDIATHASAKEYRGKHGDLNGVSMLFYHACLRYAMSRNAKNLLAIFDIPPLDNLQQFGKPFDIYKGLDSHSYGGPYPTLPAFCVIERGMQRIRDNNADVGKVFIDGALLDGSALIPNEYNTEEFSDRAVGL